MNKKLQKVVLLGAACLIAVLLVLLYVQFKPNSFPYTLESEHFTFYYTETDKDSIHQIRDKLEENYDRIVQDLAPPEMPRVKVRMYQDLSAFHKAIDREGAGDWVVGNVTEKDEMKMVSPSNPGSGQSLEYMLKVAVHEFTHVVTFNMTDYPTSYSMGWLYESLACYEAEQFTDPKDVVFIKGGRLPTFAQLTKTNGEPAIYGVGFTIIEYIRDTWGMKAVRELVASYGNIPGTLGKTAEEFEKGWQAYVQEKYLNPKKQS